MKAFVRLFLLGVCVVSPKKDYSCIECDKRVWAHQILASSNFSLINFPYESRKFHVFPNFFLNNSPSNSYPSQPQISWSNGNPLNLLEIDSSTEFWFEVSSDAEPIIEIGNIVFAGNYESMINILETNGNLIKSLTFVFNDLTIEEATNVSQLIEKYTSATLTQLILINVTEADHLLAGVERTFHSVKSLTIIRGIHADNLRLHEIYPNIEKLHISRSNKTPLHTLNQQYKKMKQLTFFTVYEDNAHASPLIKLNPNINSLVLDHMPSLATLQTISDTLVKLVTFEIQCYLEECVREFEHDGHVNFKGVTHFIIDMGRIAKRAPERIPITFDHLETLQIRVDALKSVVVDLIKNAKHLKSLALPSTVNATEMTRLADVAKELPPIQQMTLTWNPHWRGSDLQRLLMRAPALKSIKLLVEDKSLGQQAAGSFPNGWRIVSEKNVAGTDAVELDIRKSAHG